MPLPDPQVGLVINYGYVWKQEELRGQEEGRKNRPCVIILAVENIEGEKVVTVVPVTHLKPSRPDAAIELPQTVKKHLGLDDERSWMVTTEVNRFTWPGPDLGTVTREKKDQFHYGMVPANLIRKIRTQIAQRQSIEIVERTPKQTNRIRPRQ